MAKTKIVHIAQSAGGVSEYLYMFIKNSTDKFEHVLIVSNDYKEQINRFEKMVKDIYYVDMVRDINMKKDLPAIIQIRKILRQQKDYVLYLHSSKAGALGRIAMWFNRKIKIIYNAHGWYFNAKSGKKKKIFAIIEKILAYRANTIVNISQSEYDSALENKIAKAKKMCIIENGIDFGKFKDADEYRIETRKKYNISDEEIVIGAVGRLTLQKDPMTLIKAIIKVRETYKNIKVMFIGSGELEKDVIDYATENEFIEKVTITGWVSDVEKYIPALDIAVLPSKWEGFGFAIIEYMANYKPIVASNVGGIADIIDNENRGKLFEIGNENELADKICEYIENRTSMQDKLQNNYKYAIERYNIKNVVEKTEKIINTYQI